MLECIVLPALEIPFEIKEIPELEFNSIETFNDAHEQIMRKVAETILKTARETAQKAGVRKVETAIGTGDPATGILGFAERRQADLIVVGTRGLSKLKGTVMGSVSRKIANNADTSCLIVK